MKFQLPISGFKALKQHIHQRMACYKIRSGPIFMLTIVMAIAMGCNKNEMTAEGVAIGTNQWSATYKGIAVFTSGSVNSQGEYLENHLEEGVIAEAENGSSSDRFTLSIQFANTPEIVHKDYEFTGTNTYSESWGKGFESGSLNIRFTDDSLYYSSIQNCGTACFNQIEIAARRRP
jgi:hypothetical protein